MNVGSGESDSRKTSTSTPILLISMAMLGIQCSDSNDRSNTLDADTGQDLEPPSAIQNLIAASSTRPLLRTDPRGRIRQAIGSFATQGATPEERARNFIRSHADLFSLRDPDAELVLERSLADGSTLIFRRVHQGIPVFAAHLLVALEADAVHFVATALPGTVDGVAVTPTVDASTATATATAALGLTTSSDRASAPTLSLLDTSLLFGAPDIARLTWQVEVLGPSPNTMVTSFVDATTGQMLLELPVVASGLSRSIHDSNDSVDASDMAAVRALGENPGPHLALIGDSVGTLFWPSAEEQPDAIPLMEHLQAIYDYLLATFDRELWADDGIATGFVHYRYLGPNGDEHKNAFFWDDAIFFTDGIVSPDGQYTPVVSLDVAAHEVFHGVVAHTAKLLYQGESGALNEHFADFMASLVDRDTPWTIGDLSALGVIRSLSDPASHQHPRRATRQVEIPDVGACDAQGVCPVADPAIQKRACVGGRCLDIGTDNGFVHSNSGIPNHAFYLLAEGGTHADTNIRVRGIGIPRAEQIWYRALNYLVPTSQFEDFPLSLLRACMDLRGKTIPGGDVIETRDCGAINNAMAAVELLWAADRDEDMFPDSADGDNCAPPANCDAQGNCQDYFNPDQEVIAACEAGVGPSNDVVDAPDADAPETVDPRTQLYGVHIFGRVTDPVLRIGIAGARITVASEADGVVATMTTGDDGDYELMFEDLVGDAPEVPLGDGWNRDYIVRAEAAGYAHATWLAGIVIPASYLGTDQRSGFAADFNLYAHNMHCTSDASRFEVVGSSSRGIKHLPRPLGEASFAVQQYSEYHGVEAAGICVGGDPAAPTIDWNPEWYPGIDYILLKKAGSVQYDVRRAEPCGGDSEPTCVITPPFSLGLDGDGWDAIRPLTVPFEPGVEYEVELESGTYDVGDWELHFRIRP